MRIGKKKTFFVFEKIDPLYKEEILNICVFLFRLLFSVL